MKLKKEYLLLLKERNKYFVDFLRKNSTSYHDFLSIISNKKDCINYQLQDEFQQEEKPLNKKNVETLLFKIKIYRNLESRLVHNSRYYCDLKIEQAKQLNNEHLSKVILDKVDLRSIIIDEDTIYNEKYKEELKEFFKEIYPGQSLIKYLVENEN